MWKHFKFDPHTINLSPYTDINQSDVRIVEKEREFVS